MKTATSRLLNDKNAPAKRVLDEVRSNLINGKYQEGDRLLETKMAETYSVSRGTIRSILQELAAEGLVEFAASGTCLAIGINEKIIRDIYDLRGQLETKAAVIILNDPSNLCLPMVEILNEYDKKQENELFQTNPVSYHIQIDLQFHQALVYSSFNKPVFRAWCSMSPVIKTLLSLNVNSEYWETYAEKFYDHHKAILDYAITKDSRLLNEINDQIASGVENSVLQLRSLRQTDSTTKKI